MSTQQLGPYGRPVQPSTELPAIRTPEPATPEVDARTAVADAKAPTQPPIERPPGGDSVTITVQRSVAVGLGVIAATLISFIGPWVTLGPFARSGLDVGGDAPIALGLGLIGGFLLALRKTRVGVGIIGAVLVAIAIVDGQDVASRGDGGFSPSVGWGLYLSGIVGLVLFVSAFTRGSSRSS